MTRAAIEQATQTAIEEIGAGRFNSAESRCRGILAAQPDHTDALHLLANIAHLVGRNALAVELASRAIAINPAAAQYYNTLGIALHNEQRYELAITAYRNALRLRPHYAVSQSNMANTLRELGRLEEAIEAYRTALEWSPDFADAHANLGIALNSAGRWSEAIASYRAAIRFKPDSADAHNNLGSVLTELGRLDEAIEEFETAIKLKPDYALAHENLGAAAADKGRPEQAIEACLAALKLQPGLPEAYCNLGTALKDNGQIEEAQAAYRQALALRPDDAVTHSNLVYTLQFQSGVTPAVLSNEQMLWNRAHAEPLRHHGRPPGNDPDPDRRLKIGYVSPDLRDHAVAFFLLPLLEAHDRAKVEVHCYSSVRRRDAVTGQLRGKTDVWHDVQLLSDSQLADRIRADGIDILADLSMHTAYNRLLAFARKPAPVQVSWLAYAGSTGLEAIDYRLTDSIIEPPQNEEVVRHEQPYRLPDIWCCYQPGSEFPAPGELPALNTGRIMFGSVNRLCKVNEAVIRCWAGVLRTVSHSTLLLLAPEGRSRERVRQMFETHGISSERVEFVGYCSRPEYLNMFRRMDIVLDTFPYNGMTTTCHALWMGLPVVTLPGKLPASRTGLSLLSTIGLAEWAADSEEAYARIAADVAGDLPHLSEVRNSLRERMEKSPLMDPARFARNIEEAYRAMWVDWCAKTAK